MQHTVVSQDEWLAARKALLAKEKEFTRARDDFSRQRRELPWVKVDYNYSKTEFPSEEAPGLSAFIKDEAGAVFHTYSAYARGLDMLIGAYNFLYLAPKGRDEDGLPWTTAWVRRHDEYEAAAAKSCCCG